MTDRYLPREYLSLATVDIEHRNGVIIITAHKSGQQAVISADRFLQELYVENVCLTLLQLERLTQAAQELLACATNHDADNWDAKFDALKDALQKQEQA